MRAKIERQDLLTFLLAFLGYTLFAALLSFGWSIVPGDALSRSYSALAVLHSRHPHLGAIGFIWPPLTTFLQLPLALSPALTYNAFSGGVVSAFFAAALLTLLNRLLRAEGLSGRSRLFLLLPLALNPLWLYYGSVGMSEMPFLFFYTLTAYLLLRWLDSLHWRDLTLAGLGTAVMFGFRYDAIPFAAATALAIFIVTLRRKGVQAAREVEGHLFLYLMPPVYVAFLWVFSNGMFAGSPLYFLSSNYSNTALTEALQSDATVRIIKSSPLAPLAHLSLHIALLSPLLWIALWVLAQTLLTRKSYSPLAWTFTLLSPLLFQEIMFSAGKSFGLPRFFISAQVAGVLIWLFLQRQLPAAQRKGFTLAAGLLLITGMLTSGLVMGNHIRPLQGWLRPGKDAIAFINRLTAPRSAVSLYNTERQAARALEDFLATHPGLVLADTYAKEIVLYTGKPARFILPEDYDYAQALENPRLHAAYILVSDDMESIRQYSPVTAQFPNWPEQGFPGFALATSFGPYRLYRAQNSP